VSLNGYEQAENSPMHLQMLRKYAKRSREYPTTHAIGNRIESGFTLGL